MPSKQGVGSSARFELSTVPDWGDLERIRLSVGLCVDAVGGEMDLRYAATLASCELLENALRYAPAGSVIDYSLLVESGRAIIRVGNECAAGGHDGERVVGVVRWISSFAEPRDAYLAKLKELVAAHEVARGGLGLVRLAYEGGCRLRCSFDAADARAVVEAQWSARPAATAAAMCSLEDANVAQG